MKTISSLIGSLSHGEHHAVDVKKLIAGTVLMTALTGCVTTGQSKVDSAASAEQAESEVLAQQKVPESKDKPEGEAQADAMMASLAAKSKFDEQDEAPPVEKVEAKAQKKSVKPKSPKKQAKAKAKKAAPAVKAKPAKPMQQSKTVAKVEKPAKAKSEQVKPSGSSAKALNATLKDLPIEYGVWKIGKGVAVLDKDIVITTPTWEMGEAGFMSQIWLTIMDDKLLINSSSDIMAPTGKSGIKVDGSELIPFDRVVENKIGVLDGKEWLGKLAKANELEIYMGFFPDRVPKSDIYQSSLTLEKLARVAATYKRLN